MIKKLIKEYEKNIEHTQKYKSYINQVREYNGYVFKETSDLRKFNNESKWLKELMKLNYCTPKLIGTYNEKIIITEKINAYAINDENAHEHLYNIGSLLAKLHELPVKEKSDWKDFVLREYTGFRNLVQGKMDDELYNKITEYLERKINELGEVDLAIIHRDLRPENVLYSDGNYYMLDLESMCVGDIDYDFTRMFNLLNQMNTYNYKDFKNLVDGYKSVRDINISVEKWKFYNKLYAFRIYSRMLSGKINRDIKYEKYLESVLNNESDRVSKWINIYNGRM